MTNRSQNKNLTTTLLLIFAFALLTPTSYAFTGMDTIETLDTMNTLQGGSQDRPRPSRREPRNRSSRNAKPATKANETLSTEFESSLKEILTLVNENRKPDEQTLAVANSAIQANRKNIKTFDDRSQCKYMMLSAWSYHFAGDVGKAFLAASKAYKSDPENSDAHISQVALAILADRRPITIKPKTNRSRTRRTPKQRRYAEPEYDYDGMNEMETGSASARVNPNGILQLDVAAIRTDLIEPRMARFELNCVNSTKFSFVPGDSNLCMLFWQLDPKKTASPVDTIAAPVLDNDPLVQQPAEPNGFGSSRRQTGTRNYDSYDDEPDGNTSQPIDPDELEMQFFAIMFAKAALGNSSVKFVAVNTDSLENKQKVIYQLLKTPRAWAQVIAADPASNASAFADLNIETPVMAIVTKNGTVKYTGPATGFLAPMILESISPAVVTAKVNDMQNTDSQLPKAEPQVPSSANRRTSPISVKAAPPSQDSEDFAQVGVEYQAKKDLSYAQQYIKMGRYTTYKKGIDMCRSILKKYPGTEYAEKARDILRQVPERYQQRYKITNEEMGL